MRDLYLEGLLLGSLHPSTPDEFVDLVWKLAAGQSGFRSAWELYRNQKSEYYWYNAREEVAREVGPARPTLESRSALLLFSPLSFPPGAGLPLEELRRRHGRFSWLEWEPGANNGISMIKVGSILFSSPSREEVKAEIGPYVEALRRIFLNLVSSCRPEHAICGEMRVPGPPTAERARKAVAKRSFWAIDWVNMFGPAYVEKFGQDFFLQAPGHLKERLEGNRILYQVTEGFFPWEAGDPSPESVESYISSHPNGSRVRYRPWLKQALSSTEQSNDEHEPLPSATVRDRRGGLRRLLTSRKTEKSVVPRANYSKPEGLREIAESAAKSASRTLGVRLDFSPESLKILDDAIDKFFGANDGPNPTTTLTLGAYVGEVVIRNLGGHWQPSGGWLDSAVVDLGQVAELYPFRRILKRFEEGPSASVFAWYAAAARAAKP